jgi:hypothetical protein
MKQSSPKQHETPNVTLPEKGSKACEPIGNSEGSSEGPKTMMHSSSLPPTDSPLTKVFLGQYVSSLTKETILYLKLSYSGLAQQMSIPEMVLRDATEGKMGLTRGQWIKLGQILGLATSYDLRAGERNGAACWEICFSPVRVSMDKT